jgi:NAD(P)-dependent dehydrogenase (short-subunit alcohol dehydrogenase family)
VNVESAFRGKRCVITGGASGIGFALAEALSGHDAQVLIAGHDDSALKAASERLARPGCHVGWHRADVGNADEVERLIAAAVKRLGGIDFMFNNAGVGATLPIADATLAEWHRVLNVNLWGVIHCVHAVLPVMRRQGSGHIINTASASGLVPLPGRALYNTSKYAVVGLSESLRLELAQAGIKVTAVCPGPVASEIWAKSITGRSTDRKAPADAITPEAAATSILRGVAQGRGILVFPAKQRWGWRMYRWFPRLSERALRAAAHRDEIAGQL